MTIPQSIMHNKRLSTAPMIDWSTREYLTFARLFNPHSYLYTEMISTSALLYGDTDYHLRYYPNEHPVVLQLGGSHPDELAQCAKLGQDYGYDEVNLNVGCPSDRVQHYKIGACLMAEPKLVADIVRTMREAVTIPITVKHRIGIDNFGVECRVLVTDKPIMGGIFSSLSIFCGISLAVWVSFVVFYCL